MKEGFITQAGEGTPSPEELAQINRFTRRALAAEEVYTFSVVLCDNEIDRDGERFTAGALQRLAELYIGKTGIFDHSMKGSDQTARIYACAAERMPGRVTAAGEAYMRLKAKAYLPRTEKNQGLIAELDAGIKKEVSVGCAVGSVRCSICGADLRKAGCGHRKGDLYHGKRMHAVLDNPTDAYEWSFVAVPAQKEAGVIKRYGAERREQAMPMDTLKAWIGKKGAQALPPEEAERFFCYLEGLEQKAVDGEAFRDALRAKMTALCGRAPAALPQGMAEEISKKLSVSELKALCDLLESGAKGARPRPQLAPQKAGDRPGNDNEPFKI